MSNMQIACGYKVTASGGQTIAALAAALGAVPIDIAMAHFWGLLPIRDVTATVGHTATRTITLQMAPVVPATATAVLEQDTAPSGGGIQQLFLSGGGDMNGDYAAVPVITFTGGTPREHHAKARANMSLIDAIIVNPGSGYISPVATFVGGDVRPGGTIAMANVGTGVGGTIAGVSYTNRGFGYTTFPQIVITDVPGGGSGAIIYGGLSLESLTLFDPGIYTTAPTVVITPYFQASNPDSSNQASTVAGFMTRVLEEALRCAVSPVPPVIS